MNRSFSIRPFSALLGAVSVVGVLLLSSQATPYSLSSLAIGAYGPHPREMVQIKEGTPFTVPAGRIFSLTALGGAIYGTNVSFRVDGQLEVFGYAGDGVSVAFVPQGFTARGGKTITVQNANPEGLACAWGFLANE